jgi:hypothetical protein
VKDTRITLDAETYPTSIHDGRRFRNGHRVRLGAIEAEATALAEARRLVAEKAATFLDHFQPPRFLSRGDYTFAIFPAIPEGGDPCWTSRIIHNGKAGGYSTSKSTFAEVKAGVRRHLAQLTCDSHDPDSVAATCVWITEQGGSPEEARDLMLDAAFQRAARWANDHPDEIEGDWHRWACEHKADFLTRWPALDTAAA